jgi:methylated-DNA-[protein]-cysteine S-methyltransferase
VRSVLKAIYTVVETGFGWLAICGSESGPSLVTLPEPSLDTALTRVKNTAQGAVEDASAFGDLARRFQRYFDGEKIAFSDTLDLHGATAFQRAVWSTARSIPYGETRTYAWIAGQIDRPGACRAVGGAMARNRFPVIVPCHRVIASDGTLGGFSGGLAMKESFLRLETPAS